VVHVVNPEIDERLAERRGTGSGEAENEKFHRDDAGVG
jgi:hypothetical protein